MGKNDMNSNNSLTPSQDLKPIRPSPKINNLNFQTNKQEDQDLELELSNNSGSPGEMEYTGTTSTPQGYQELQNQTGQESSSNDSQKVQIKILRHTQAAPVTIHLPTLPSNQKQGTSHKVLIKDKETSYPKSGMVLKTSMSSISPISEDEVINTSGIPKKTKVVSLKELKRRSSKEDILPIHKSTLTSEKCITRAMQDGSSTKLSNSKPPLPEKIKQKYSSEIFNRKLDMVDQTDKSSTPSLNERLSGLPLKFDKILNIDSTVENTSAGNRTPILVVEESDREVSARTSGSVINDEHRAFVKIDYKSPTQSSGKKICRKLPSVDVDSLSLTEFKNKLAFESNRILGK